MHTHQVRIRLDAIDRHRGKLRRHGLRRLRFLEFLRVFRFFRFLEAFGVFWLFERLEFLGRSDFLNFLCLALRGMLRVRRFCRVERKCRREHREHQHQCQHQRKHSFLHVRIPLLSFVLCGTAYAQFRKLSSIVYHICPEFPVPTSFSLSYSSNRASFCFFHLCFSFPQNPPPKIRFLCKKRTAEIDRSLFLCN